MTMRRIVASFLLLASFLFLLFLLLAKSNDPDPEVVVMPVVIKNLQEDWQKVLQKDIARELWLAQRVGKMHRPASSTATTTEMKKEAPKSKSGKAQKKAEAPTQNEKGMVVKEEETKQVVIEHCKQCNSFKVQATKVQAALKAAIPTLEVSITSQDEVVLKCVMQMESHTSLSITCKDLKKIVENLKA